MLGYEEVKKCWDGLHVLHGLAGLAQLKDFDHECAKETLMHFVPVVAVTDPHIKHAMISTIQFFTVMGCMTFKAQMDGQDEISPFYVWIDYEEAKQGLQLNMFLPDLAFEDRVKNMCCNMAQLEHWKRVVTLSQKYLDTLLQEIVTSAESVRSNMRLCRLFLNDLELALNQLIVDKD